MYSASAKIAFGIDVKGNLVGFSNHSSGQGLLVNYSNETVVVVDLNKWGHKLEFPFNIRNNISLQNLYKQGEKISKGEASEIIRKSLIVLTAGEYDISSSESWNLFIHLTRSLAVSLKTVIAVIKTGTFIADTNLFRLIEVIDSLATLDTYIEGGLKVVLDYHATISLKALLNTESTLEMLECIWEQLKDADLGRIFHGLKTSVDVVQLLSGLSANSTTGVNGLITLLAKVVLFVHGQESLHILTEVMVEVAAKNKDYPNLLPKFRQGVDNLYKLIVKLNLQLKLKVVYKLLVEIRSRTWAEGGVSLSNIIKNIDDGLGQNPLKLVIRLLKCLKPKTSMELAISTLVLHIIGVLANRGGAGIIGNLVGFRVNKEILEADPSPLAVILRGFSPSDLWSAPIGKVLAGLPVIGQVITGIDDQLKANGICLTVEKALENSASGGLKRIIIEYIEPSFEYLEPVKAASSPANLGSVTPSQNESSPSPKNDDGENGNGGKSKETTTEGKGDGSNEYGDFDISGLKGADGKHPSEKGKSILELSK